MLKILRRIKRRLTPVPVFKVDDVDLRHLEGSVAELVRRRLLDGTPVGQLDGDRSVRLPHPDRPGYEIKIKGAGFQGGSVLFGTWHRTGPAAPLFDFDGRMMEDVASGHDNAYHGGASFQQAATEYNMARLLDSKGYAVVPCLGYGSVRHGQMQSWFSVHEVGADWRTISPTNVSLDEYLASKAELGRLTLELAVVHGIVGYSALVSAPGQPPRFKDLHPFRAVDPLSMSALSWVMQVFFALHIQALSGLHFVSKGHPGIDTSAAQISVFRAICPKVTLADHQALRQQLVAPYMLRPPAQFDPAVLNRILAGNPITRALLDACPPEYVRY